MKDVGTFLRDQIVAHVAGGLDVELKRRASSS
jgi:hypothetical protein